MKNLKIIGKMWRNIGEYLYINQIITIIIYKSLKDKIFYIFYEKSIDKLLRMVYTKTIKRNKQNKI